MGSSRHLEVSLSLPSPLELAYRPRQGFSPWSGEVEAQFYRVPLFVALIRTLTPLLLLLTSLVDWTFECSLYAASQRSLTSARVAFVCQCGLCARLEYVASYHATCALDREQCCGWLNGGGRWCYENDLGR